MPQETVNSSARPDQTGWKSVIVPYQKSSLSRAIWQLVNTVGGYLLVWCLMYFAVKVSWWLAVPLAILGGGLLVRVFIIFHDCAHSSFVRSRRANQWIGRICGLLTFTPYQDWRWRHAVHHASAGDLDRRGVGDVWTMTVSEYLASSRLRRLTYRFMRNPVVLFLVAPLYLFTIHHRFAGSKRTWPSAWGTTFSLAVMITVMSLIFGVGTYLVLQFIVLSIAGAAGVWLFYVQHQFEDAYWEHTDEWDYTAAAMQGSSFYKLPRILQWFSGNIGFHHIHHLSPRIPNYHLEHCHRSNEIFHDVKVITVWSSLKSLFYHLWDESEKKLVGFRQVHRQQRRQQCLAND